MYVGYDSTTPDEIPHDAQLVLPYNSGDYNWALRARALFPRAYVQEVSVEHAVPGHFFDIEKGAGTPAEFIDWWRMSAQRGFWRPGPYGSRSTLATVIPEIERAGLPRRSYRVWGADPTQSPHIPDDWDGCQYWWGSGTHNFDVSLFRAGTMPPSHADQDHVYLAKVKIDAHTGHWDVKGIPEIDW